MDAGQCSHFHERRENKSFVQTRPIEYFGPAEGCYLGVQERQENFSITRIFGSLVMFWRYSYDGRINNIGCSVPGNPKRTYCPITYLNSTDSEFAWEQGEASIFPLPQQICCIKGIVDKLPLEEQFQIIFNKGRVCATRLLSTLSKPPVQMEVREHQLPLYHLAESAPVCHALEFIVAHEPKIALEPPATLRISYSPLP